MSNADVPNLTEKQRRFVEAYMGKAKGNATEAYKLAGYKITTDNVAAVEGCKLLRIPKIRSAIDARADADPLVLDREALQQFWSRIATGDEDNNGDAIAMKDRIKASELLAKSQAVFVDRVETTHSGSVTTTYELAFTARDPIDEDDDGD